MLTPPDGFPDEVLVQTLAQAWHLDVASIDYRPVGFGSHHWEVVDTRDSRWFVTVDDLASKRHSLNEPQGAAFRRLRAALATARSLRDVGCTFVVAPVATNAGAPLVRMDDRFALALYPFVAGRTYEWAEFATPKHRRGVLDLVVALHTVPSTATPHAIADDFAVPLRDVLESHLDDDAGRESGPYADRTRSLLVENAERISQLFARYDDLVARVKDESAWPMRAVLTHGEPHPGNTILTNDGWFLIDWDTAMVAVPERDLWSLDPGDGSIFRAYADATGTTPLPSALALFRIRWDLSEIAVYVNTFREAHTGTPDDHKSWDELCSVIACLPA